MTLGKHNASKFTIVGDVVCLTKHRGEKIGELKGSVVQMGDLNEGVSFKHIATIVSIINKLVHFLLKPFHSIFSSLSHLRAISSACSRMAEYATFSINGCNQLIAVTIVCIYLLPNTAIVPI